MVKWLYLFGFLALVFGGCHFWLHRRCSAPRPIKYQQSGAFFYSRRRPRCMTARRRHGRAVFTNGCTLTWFSPNPGGRCIGQYRGGAALATLRDEPKPVEPVHPVVSGPKFTVILTPAWRRSTCARCSLSSGCGTETGFAWRGHPDIDARSRPGAMPVKNCTDTFDPLTFKFDSLHFYLPEFVQYRSPKIHKPGRRRSWDVDNVATAWIEFRTAGWLNRAGGWRSEVGRLVCSLLIAISKFDRKPHPRLNSCGDHDIYDLAESVEPVID